MKIILTFILIVALSLTGFSQSKHHANDGQNQKYSYAYISVQGKAFSKKLKVEVDFGDTQEQINAGKEYSEILTNRKSYAAILNYMVENKYELVETLDYTYNYSGTGGTSGVVFIMKRKAG